MVIFAGMALKLEKGGPTFSVSIHVHPTLGTKGFLSRADACLGVGRRPTVDRNRKPRMKSLWHPGYVHPFHP